jgi:O-6-methylguanine DNA methyltransferase
VVRATETRYAVPGWGVGELWTSSVAVLAHEFTFEPEQLVAARPLQGAVSPPTGTLSGQHTRERDGFAPASRREPEAPEPPDLDFCLDLDPHGLVARFTAYLAGADVGFDAVPLDLDDCTPFQRAVATTLRAVPRGTVVSYAELAALAGYPGAQRAVGTFCARNRFAFLLPCHRVVGADGIGGYGSAGVTVKRRLLALEGVTGLAA